MRADRIVLRRAWRSDCPPIFNRWQRVQTAFRRGLPKPKERTTYREWLSKLFARRVQAPIYVPDVTEGT